MRFHPHNGTVLCVLEKQEKKQQTIVFDEELLPIYRIIETGIIDKQYDFNVGDRIVSNSVPTKIKDGDNEFFLVKLEYIAGKII